MKTKCWLVLLLQLFFLQTAFAANFCQTHEVCPANTTCSCTVPADGMYTRSFYFDISALQQGKVYECQLNGNEPRLILSQSSLPAGSKMLQCSGDCSDFPITFQLDTSGMLSQQDTMELKYSVPPSDIPTDVGVSCK